MTNYQAGYELHTDDTTEQMARYTGTFFDAGTEANFGTQRFRDHHNLHISLLVGIVVVQFLEFSSHATFAAVFTLVGLTVGLGLRHYAHRMSDVFKAQRLGSLAWTALTVLSIVPSVANVAKLYLFHDATPVDGCPMDFSLRPVPFWVAPVVMDVIDGANVVLVGFGWAWVSASHGMKFWHVTSLAGLVVCDYLLNIPTCRTSAGRQALVSGLAALVLGWAAAHHSQLLQRGNCAWYLTQQQEQQQQQRERDDAAADAQHFLEQKLKETRLFLLQLRSREAGGKVADAAIAAANGEIERLREELSRASVRVNEAVARRQAAERINRRARKSRHDAEDPPSESESDDE